jgi:hypothetical protein
MEMGLLNGRQSQIAIRTLIQVGYRRRDLLAKGRPPCWKHCPLPIGNLSDQVGNLSPKDFHPRLQRLIWFSAAHGKTQDSRT